MIDQLETLTIDEMSTLFKSSKAKIYRMVADGQLPKPVRMGRKSHWLKSSVEKAVELMKKRSEALMVANDKRFGRAA